MDISHLAAKSTFSRLGASRLLHLYWFRGLQGGTASKSTHREAFPIDLGVSPVTLATFREYKKYVIRIMLVEEDDHSESM